MRIADISIREVLAMASMACIVFVCVVSFLSGSYLQAVDNFADNSSYIAIASAIQHWDFHGLLIKQFWGLSYLIAAVSWITGSTGRTSLLMVSLASYLISIVMTHRLWGGWIAGLFAVINFDWLQRAFLGGSEPLFVALLFSSFLMARRNKWFAAALLASLSTVVRPLGLFALLGIAIELIARRQNRRLIFVTLIGVLIGSAYVWPLWRQLGDPLATVHSYQSFDQPGPALFGIPFYAIIKGTVLYPTPWTNLVLTWGWIFFILCGAIALFYSARSRQFMKTHMVETTFTLCYLLAIYSYNLPYWARGNFPRFAIPIIPFTLFALLPWIPKSRYLLWPLIIVCPALAACSAIGVKNVFPLLQR